MNRATVPPVPPHLNLPAGRSAGKYSRRAADPRRGIAHVYLAHDAGTDGEVAIKVLLPRLVGDAASAERLRREAVIAMRLDHPNVCRILDVGETPELPIYLVMPYLRGEELAIRQLCRGPLPVHEGIPLLLQICRGLEHAHGLQTSTAISNPKTSCWCPIPASRAEFGPWSWTSDLRRSSMSRAWAGSRRPACHSARRSS